MAALAVLITGCQSGPYAGSGPASQQPIHLSALPASSSPIPTDEPSTSPAASSPSPSEAPAATTAGCPPPWEICAATSATGNFDGNSQQERFSASPIWNASGSIDDWLLAASLPRSRSVSARLSNLTAAQDTCPALDLGIPYVVLRGAASFAGSSRELALIEVSHGASTRFAILVGIQNGRLQVATVANGAERCQRIFPFGGSATHGNGLACGWRGATPVLWVRQVEDHPPDYAHYDWYQATYAWQGLQLYLLSLDHAVITSDDPRFGPSYAVACGSVRIPA